MSDFVKDTNVPTNGCISRQAAIEAILAIKDYGNSDRANALGLAECAVTTLPSAQPEITRCKDCKHRDPEDAVGAIENLPPAESEPAIPLSWIEGQIKWLKSLDNAFSTLTAGQISAMVNKWRGEQDG